MTLNQYIRHFGVKKVPPGSVRLSPIQYKLGVKHTDVMGNTETSIFITAPAFVTAFPGATGEYKQKNTSRILYTIHPDGNSKTMSVFSI